MQRNGAGSTVAGRLSVAGLGRGQVGEAASEFESLAREIAKRMHLKVPVSS